MFQYKLLSQPDLLALHRVNPKRYPFLLERSSASESSRYSLLFAFPGDSLRVEYGSKNHFTSAFDRLFSAEKPSPLKQNTEHNREHAKLPFSGGWFVYLGYELAGQIEPVLALKADVFKLPLAIATRVKTAIIIDHQKQESWLVSECENKQELMQVKEDLASALEVVPDTLGVELKEDDPQQYLDGVAHISEYIRSGDVFQVNLSRAWNGTFKNNVDAAQIYSGLRQANPAPFSALVNYHDFSIISSSPERLVSVTNNVIETRPIAGTRPRSEDSAQDEQLLQELISHPKERAEHIMLIDLERNDMGRICKPGTVDVNELMMVESYEHVHHIVSNIRGELQQGVTPGDVINAVFPGGTITGCPKVRCMEIIAELESVGRGPYTGSVGYINHSGDMDLNILIRTMVMKDKQLNFRTGAGIVYDSIAQNEVEETRHKAKGLLRTFSCG